MVKKSKGRQARDLHKVLPSFYMKRISEGSFILILMTSLFSFLALLSDGFSLMPAMVNTNAEGWIGASVAMGLKAAFGYFSFLVPLGIVYFSWYLFRDLHAQRPLNKYLLGLKSASIIVFMVGVCGLMSLKWPAVMTLPSAGGTFGQALGSSLVKLFNYEGAVLLLLAMSLAGVTWLTGLSWLRLLEIVGYGFFVGMEWSFKVINATVHSGQMLFERFKNRDIKEKIVRKERTKSTFKKDKMRPVLEKVLVEESRPALSAMQEAKTMIRPKFRRANGLPSLNLLDKGEPGKPMGGYTHQELETLSREVEQHLLDFGIQVDVVAVHPGPVITRFELQLAAGVKVSKLTALSKDLARSLSVTSVRVVEIIPGKTVVGIELPNQYRAIVRLSDVLIADVYQQAVSPISLALGVDIAGHPMVVDLAKMPHLLVAGTTGSGKSVGINAMILSLLFKSSPEQVRLILVDPKMLELSVYDGIPHLLTPVVTDMKEAASALRWCVAEMDRRYRLMASLGVRNLAGFNAKITENIAAGTPLRDPLWKPTDSISTEAPLLQTLPFIVVVIDELADMMMVVGKKVEQLIARIAQKARAAGIHLILATQRPSVDVLTGLIKSNIPTRISFQVSSKIDSRTILDQQGAEQLLGHGDMLFLAPGTGAPLRVHGVFVDDQEVHRVVADWRERGEPEYIDEVTQLTGESMDGGFSEEGQGTGEADPFYDQAVEFVSQTRKASVSALQRRFKVGYNRAARLMEDMERAGVVGPLDGGVRDVLVSSVAEDE